jgi:diguanylate cyclase (GGDEF)-like protein
MTDLTIPSTAVSRPGAEPPDLIRGALEESRRRWRQFVGLAADMAFETDIQGRLVFVMPDDVLGWPAGMLVGQPSELLIDDGGGVSGFNPFRPVAEFRRRGAWIRRCDGTLAMMAISAAPLTDAAGGITGSRGICIDMTDADARSAVIAGSLRRGEVLDHILSRIGQEAAADHMMDAALWAMINALTAEGAAVIAGGDNDPGYRPEETDGRRRPDASRPRALHECGPGAASVIDATRRLIGADVDDPRTGIAPDGRRIRAAGCLLRSGRRAGLALWRAAHARPWDREDLLIAQSAMSIVRIVLEYETTRRDMAHQARTDPLTGLLNRRAFMDDLHGQCSRMDRESTPGSLLFIDLDGFKAVNDQFGHATGDAVLIRLALILRKLVRPSDLIARLGGDEFAIWLSGADQLTAAERADHLCRTAPAELSCAVPEAFPDLGLSIGIALRRPGDTGPVETLMRRADVAMYEVKRAGRRHWQVAAEGVV